MSAHAMPLTRRDWIVPASLILLSLVPAIAGTARLADLAGNGEVTAANQRFHAMPLPVVLHIVGALPYSMLGALQFSRGFRRRIRWHRELGKVLGVCGLVVAFSGLWMTLAYPWANHDGEAVFVMRLLFGSAMAYAIVMGVDAVVRRRDLGAHGAWMIRAYAIGLGAGTQVLTHLPWFILADGAPGELPRAVMMGAGWVINAAVAEWIIRRGAQRSTKSQRVTSPGSNPPIRARRLVGQDAGQVTRRTLLA